MFNPKYVMACCWCAAALGTGVSSVLRIGMFNPKYVMACCWCSAALGTGVSSVLWIGMFNPKYVVACCWCTAALWTGVSSVLRIGIFNPKYREKDVFDMMAQEWRYVADYLGISTSPPSSELGISSSQSSTDRPASE